MVGQLRWFIGILNFSRRCISRAADVLALLNKLLNNRASIAWILETKTTFWNSKPAPANATITLLLRSNILLALGRDTSNTAICTALKGEEFLGGTTSTGIFVQKVVVQRDMLLLLQSGAAHCFHHNQAIPLLSGGTMLHSAHRSFNYIQKSLKFLLRGPKKTSDLERIPLSTHLSPGLGIPHKFRGYVRLGYGSVHPHVVGQKFFGKLLFRTQPRVRNFSS